MQCPECSATIEQPAAACPRCGAELQAPARRAHSRAHARRARIRVHFALALAVLFLVVFAVALLRPAIPPAIKAPTVPTSSAEPTAPLDPVRAAIEKTIQGFYATIDAGGSITLSPYVYPKGPGGPAPAQTESSATTTFSIARAVVGSETADVYGRESRDVIAKDKAEVEFRLRLVQGQWLVSSWKIAREATITPGVLALSDATARDVVSTLLQARQSGDATTVRMLTTQRFQLAHGSWLDGVDRSALLAGYKIVSTRPVGTTFAVTVAEEWKPTPMTTTYTVVVSNDEILVDAWTWK